MAPASTKARSGALTQGGEAEGRRLGVHDERTVLDQALVALAELAPVSSVIWALAPWT